MSTAIRPPVASVPLSSKRASEEDVLAALLGENLSTKKAPGTEDTVDDLAEIVMRTAFDVRGLTAKQIGQLLADGNDLRRFQNALVTIVAPAITDRTSAANDWKRQLPT